MRGRAEMQTPQRPLTHYPVSAEAGFMNTISETWLPIPSFEGIYDVSDLGRVRSWLPYRGTPLPRLRAVVIGNHGYQIVCLRADGVESTHLVHALVLRAFVGPRQAGMEVRHLDGNKSNRALSNLAYGSSSENTLDLVRHGTHNNARKEECKHGHAFTPANTLPRKYGGRACRACARRRSAAFNERRQPTKTQE